MINDKIIVTMMVKNLPSTLIYGYVVARQDNGEVWFYGDYETEERAREVAIELGNGLYFEVR